MADDYRDLVNRLFATATAMLEEATELAVAGQSPKRRPGELIKLARKLEGATLDVVATAEAAGVAARLTRAPRGARGK